MARTARPTRPASIISSTLTDPMRRAMVEALIVGNGKITLDPHEMERLWGRDMVEEVEATGTFVLTEAGRQAAQHEVDVMRGLAQMFLDAVSVEETAEVMKVDVAVVKAWAA